MKCFTCTLILPVCTTWPLCPGTLRSCSRWSCASCMGRRGRRTTTPWPTSPSSSSSPFSSSPSTSSTGLAYIGRELSNWDFSQAFASKISAFQHAHAFSLFLKTQDDNELIMLSCDICANTENWINIFLSFFLIPTFGNLTLATKCNILVLCIFKREKQKMGVAYFSLKVLVSLVLWIILQVCQERVWSEE